MLNPSLNSGQWLGKFLINIPFTSKCDSQFRNIRERDMTHIEAMSTWCVAYDKYKCEHVSGLQSPSLPTFYSGNWAGNSGKIR